MGAELFHSYRPTDIKDRANIDLSQVFECLRITHFTTEEHLQFRLYKGN